MWVGQLGGDVHFEVIMIGNYSISQLEHRTALLLVCLRNTQTHKHTATLE